MGSRSQSVVLLSLLSLLSAFLLFQVQPIISKFILPWFGGSPGVWTTCMLFFQLVLFLGYAYAHGLTRLPVRTQAVVHGALLLLACLVLPIQPEATWKPEGGEEPSLRILLLLAATVGLPYFVLSSTSPLVQVWFTRAVPGGQPWRLYALSNLGSLGALLSYPFFFEVRWGVESQTWQWSIAFGLFVLLSALCLVADRRHASSNPQSGSAAAAEPLSFSRRLSWLLLPALGSILLLAATNHVCQDVAVIPFLWVIPLSLYLLTFIICFEHERWYQAWLWAPLAIAVATLAAVYPEQDWDLSYKTELLICFGAVFLGCMICHGELVRLKPHPSRLTGFYLTMSAGGALGGIAVSLIAPRVFTTYTEWPLALIILILLSAAVIGRLIAPAGSSPMKLAARGLLLVMAAVGAAYVGKQSLVPPERLVRARNFYGAVSVYEGYDDYTHQDYRYLYYGGIIHGLQNLGDGYREEPVSYYGPHTGIGRALDWARERSDAHVGIIGMGTASALCYGGQGQRWRFYEINPAVIEIAQRDFTYIADFGRRGGELTIVEGDARLALEAEPDQKFDVLLLDAFSGDSVPVHLLTREAFEIYDRHLKEDGILVAHCTNRYLALASVVQKIADEMGFETSRIATDEEGDHEITDYLLLSRNRAFLEANPDDSPWEEILLDIPVWTDQRHNLFSILEKE